MRTLKFKSKSATAQPSAEFRFECVCRQHYSAQEDMRGEPIVCSSCGATFNIPRLPGAPTPMCQTIVMGRRVDQIPVKRAPQPPAQPERIVVQEDSLFGDVFRTILVFLAGGVLFMWLSGGFESSLDAVQIGENSTTYCYSNGRKVEVSSDWVVDERGKKLTTYRVRRR